MNLANSLSVIITHEDCMRYNYVSNDGCPLARAVKEVLSCKEVEVYPFHELGKQGEWYSGVIVGKAARKWGCGFDDSFTYVTATPYGSEEYDTIRNTPGSSMEIILLKL